MRLSVVKPSLGKLTERLSGSSAVVLSIESASVVCSGCSSAVC